MVGGFLLSEDQNIIQNQQVSRHDQVQSNKADVLQVISLVGNYMILSNGDVIFIPSCHRPLLVRWMKKDDMVIRYINFPSFFYHGKRIKII